MPVIRDTVSCESCCTQDTENYWRLTGYSTAAIDTETPPTCTSTPDLTIDDACFFGTPLQVLLAAVSGSITVTCPGCPPLDPSNCSGGTVNFCGASNTYMLPAVFSDPSRIQYISLDFFGDTAKAIVDFEDCATPINTKDIRFLFDFEKCTP